VSTLAPLGVNAVPGLAATQQNFAVESTGWTLAQLEVNVVRVLAIPRHRDFAVE